MLSVLQESNNRLPEAPEQLVKLHRTQSQSPCSTELAGLFNSYSPPPNATDAHAATPYYMSIAFPETPSYHTP